MVDIFNELVMSKVITIRREVAVVFKENIEEITIFIGRRGRFVYLV